MKKSKFATLVLSASVAISTVLTGCTSAPSNSGTSGSGNSNSTPASTPANSTGTSTPGGTTSGDTSTPTNTDIPAISPDLAFAKGTVLRMGTGYNSTQTGLFFDSKTIGAANGIKPEKDADGKEIPLDPSAVGSVTLADGKTYNSGDLKPTWVAVQDKLGMKFENVYQGNSASKEWAYWKEQLHNVDVVSGTASDLNQAGPAGLVVNLADYLDKMPNFKAYLDNNPIVRLSITGDTDTGAIYFSPYFDGVNDIERMPLMRTDWVQKLLDGEGAFTADKSNDTAEPKYQPFMPTTGKFEVDVVKKDGSGAEKITKDYDAANNIIKLMNDKGSMSGVEAVNMLREYIDKAYNNYYGTTRSDLFVGQNAAWDADELVALLRCVVANPQTLNGTDTIQGLFSREDNNNQRRVDMFRFAGTLFGVRGMESRQDYLYIGHDNLLHDARQDADAYKALERMNAMVQEGIISESFVNRSKEKSETMLENDLGFMHYDYNQTQTLYNEKKLQDGEKYMAAMVPVSRWNDGTGEKIMRFTESWRSVKTDGWAISKAGVGDNQDKLYAALSIIDYAYSHEGQVLMSYGPDAFIKTKSDGSYETFNFNGEEWPVIADATYAELWKVAGGNYTNYARQYLGSTLSFAKSQAFEYQCTHAVGREGAGYISNAIRYGTIKHPELALAENPWYTSVPTTLPNTKEENDQLAGFTELSANGKFSQSSGDDKDNLFVNIIVGGYAGANEGVTSAEDMAKKVADDWNGTQYLTLKGTAWTYLQDYYKTL